MMPTQIEKMQAHASHLLDSFIHLRERYAMLEPMLFVEEVPKTSGSGKQARGFRILRHSLFLSCAQDIAKLSLDDDKRTPSIKNLVASLRDDSVRGQLRELFSSWHAPLAEEETDPGILEALCKMNLREETERRVQFDASWSEVQQSWADLAASSYMSAFLAIRDKVAAHTEVQYVADKYQFVDIGALGLKWSELGTAIKAMQRLIEGLSLLVRNSGFAWEMLDEQLSRASRNFWLPLNDAA